jgi:phenylalanyl-tRNA synthetase beta chain
MRVSLNWIKEFAHVELPVDGLVEKIGAQLGEIEAVIDLGKRYQGIIIARVVSCEDHPNADKLHVCKIDDGGKATTVERDSDGHIQVVCGAPNVRAGLLVAWLPPGTVVPDSVAAEPFTLEVREIRGQKSNGMLASPKELSISDNHDGILEITEGAKPGDDFAKAFKLDDHIIAIENKMFTHRPDCFGQLGVAREIAGILGQKFTSPAWYLGKEPLLKPITTSDAFPLTISNELPTLVPRFTAQILSGVSIVPSDAETQSLLSKLGVRPINNVVDVTNAVMLLTGQPLHAYDYDKVAALSSDQGAQIVIRYPKPGETIELLNGKTIEPRAEAIMIATDQTLIGLGGVMGGASTQVDEHTTNILLECANFDMYSIRRTSMTQGIFSDAVTRFTKGQSPLQCDKVLRFAINNIVGEESGGDIIGELLDDNHVANPNFIHPPVSLSVGFINARLGSKLAAQEIMTLLENVEMSVRVSGDMLQVKAPFWRTDIEIPEDIVEEVGRLYGYDRLPLVLPRRSLKPAERDAELELKRQIRNVLATAGANEVLTYSFVHANVIERASQKVSEAFQIASALSPDLQYYRLSVMPSLLEKVYSNSKSGFDQFALFELGKAHNIQAIGKDELPSEMNIVSLVFAASERVAKEYAGSPYYYARAYLTSLLDHFGVIDNVSFEPLAAADISGTAWLTQLVAPYEPARSAVVRDAAGTVWGVVGEFKASVRRNFKLPVLCAGFELGPRLFLQATKKSAYTKLSRFPSVEQDICLRVASSTAFVAVSQLVWQTLQQAKGEQSYVTSELLDIYQRADDPDHKQITFRLRVASYEKTLTDNEVSLILNSVASAAKEKLGAERV